MKTGQILSPERGRQKRYVVYCQSTVVFPSWTSPVQLQSSPRPVGEHPRRYRDQLATNARNALSGHAGHQARADDHFASEQVNAWGQQLDVLHPVADFVRIPVFAPWDKVSLANEAAAGKEFINACGGRPDATCSAALEAIFDGSKIGGRPIGCILNPTGKLKIKLGSDLADNIFMPHGSVEQLKWCGLAMAGLATLVLTACSSKSHDLILACRSGNEPLVRTLLERGVDPNSTSIAGWPALVEAAFYDRKSICSLLVHAGAHVNAPNPNGFTALTEAARLGDFDLVQMLLRGGASVNKKTKDGATALSVACIKGHSQVVDTLYCFPVGLI